MEPPMSMVEQAGRPDFVHFEPVNHTTGFFRFYSTFFMNDRFHLCAIRERRKNIIHKNQGQF
jgi:hypothetical protein